MSHLRFAAAAAFVMLAADSVMIPFVMRPAFKAALGDAMLDTLRLGPAALFYVVHVAGLTWFAAHTASVRSALMNGTVLGFVSYSCYEMTSWTIMREWTLQLVALDLAWGTVLSGTAAAAGKWFSAARQPS